MELILASTSRYRHALLQRLQITFRCVAPRADETPRAGEAPRALAERLAIAKALSVAERNPASLVIGSDQVAERDGVLLGKPGDLTTATMQLRASSGREVHFHTGVALVHIDRGLRLTHVEPFTVRFRDLQDEQIAEYLARDRPFDCAGSFKAESLGIALFEQLRGDDPTSLEGLPLIALTTLLSQAGLPVLGKLPA